MKKRLERILLTLAMTLALIPALGGGARAAKTPEHLSSACRTAAHTPASGRICAMNG